MATRTHCHVDQTSCHITIILPLSLRIIFRLVITFSPCKICASFCDFQTRHPTCLAVTQSVKEEGTVQRSVIGHRRVSTLVSLICLSLAGWPLKDQFQLRNCITLTSSVCTHFALHDCDAGVGSSKIDADDVTTSRSTARAAIRSMTAWETLQSILFLFLSPQTNYFLGRVQADDQKVHAAATMSWIRSRRSNQTNWQISDDKWYCSGFPPAVQPHLNARALFVHLCIMLLASVAAGVGLLRTLYMHEWPQQRRNKLNFTAEDNLTAAPPDLDVPMCWAHLDPVKITDKPTMFVPAVISAGAWL